MIYFLEDDDSIRELVVYTLNNTGLPAVGFAHPEAFWKAVEQDIPGLVLLDIMLPGEDGLSVLKKLRAGTRTARIPVMMVSAKSGEYDKVIGLDGGADDYVTKPFGMMELVSRVKALLRRSEQAASTSEYRLGLLYVNVAACKVKVDGESVILTHKEFALLRLLLENRGVVLNRDQILNHVWGYGFDGENRTVDVHIRTLRTKLGVCGDYIETVRGMGYTIGGDNA